MLAADEHWRSLVPHVDELRGSTKLKGKPTPEQLEGLQRVKEELKAAEAELAAAEAERDERALRVPNPPHESVPSGASEDDVEELRLGSVTPDIAEPIEHTEVGRFDMDRAARIAALAVRLLDRGHGPAGARPLPAGARPDCGQGLRPRAPPVLVREEALVGPVVPSDDPNVYGSRVRTSTSPARRRSRSAACTSERSSLRRAAPATAASPGARSEAGAAGQDTRGMSASTSSRRWSSSCSRHPRTRGTSTSACSRTPRRSSRARPPYRSSCCRQVTCRRRPRRRTTSRSGFRPGSLPRDGVDLQHDRFRPGARHPVSRRPRPRAGAHVQRHGSRRPHGTRDPGELPGRSPDVLVAYGAPERVER